jgi:hypothetical protein
MVTLTKYIWNFFNSMNLTVKHLNKFFLHILLVVSIFCTEVYVKGACITKFPYS